MIPRQLQNQELRFIKIAKDDKRPMELEWVRKNNYVASDVNLINHVLNGGNYGIVCGYNNLIVLDFDSADAYEKIRKFLPKTFTVITANKKLPHVYYYVRNFDGNQPKSKKFINDKKETLIDMQGEGKQVVAPFSKIKDNIYKVWIDEEITTIDYNNLIQLLKTLFTPLISLLPVKKSMPSFSNHKGYYNNVFDRISIPQVLNALGVKLTNRTHACCPMHSSVNEKCLHYDDSRWYCFSCCSGGYSQNLIMMAKKMNYGQALKWAEERWGKCHNL